VEISEPKTTKEGDQAKQKFFAVKSQPKRAADNPRISQSLLQEGEDAWRQVRIGMQEKQDLTSRLARPGIHLDGTTPFAVDHPGMWPDGLNRPIQTAAVTDNDLNSPCWFLTLCRQGRIALASFKAGIITETFMYNDSWGYSLILALFYPF